jgi:hypothetical protein
VRVFISNLAHDQGEEDEDTEMGGEESAAAASGTPLATIPPEDSAMDTTGETPATSGAEVSLSTTIPSTAVSGTEEVVPSVAERATDEAVTTKVDGADGVPAATGAEESKEEEDTSMVGTPASTAEKPATPVVSGDASESMNVPSSTASENGGVTLSGAEIESGAFAAKATDKFPSWTLRVEGRLLDVSGMSVGCFFFPTPGIH